MKLLFNIFFFFTIISCSHYIKPNPIPKLHHDELIIDTQKRKDDRERRYFQPGGWWPE